MTALFAKARFCYRAYKARWRDQRAEIRTMLSAIRPGDTVVDVGAHKGAYLCWMRKAVGPTGKVLAFEPQPALCQYLNSMVSGMAWRNVGVMPIAISSQKGQMLLHIPAGTGDTSPGASLEIHAHTHQHKIQCAVDTLDNILRNEPAVSFIKCDVEGHELEVFKGASRVLEQHGPAILFECEQRHLSSHSMRDVFDFLQRMGYSGTFISGAGLAPLSEFDPAKHQRASEERYWDRKGYFNNFFFVKDSRMNAQRR